MIKDPGQEYNRLADLYSHKTDDELAELAGEPEALTETARLALESEIGRRGLKIAPQHQHEVYAEPRAVATAAKFKDLQEAALAKGLLESAGIDCWLIDENVAGLYMAQIVGGIKLQVNKDDVEAAIEVLKQAEDESQPGDDAEHG